MKNISEIDSNFKVGESIQKENIKFYNALNTLFKIYGVFYENGKFRRMPENIAKLVSDGVHCLHANTAGGRVRFITDSAYVAISVVYESTGKMSHFALTGSMGFDLYVNNSYGGTFIPPYNAENYESIIEIWNNDIKDITINFPLYSEVKELYIGLDSNAFIKEPKPYINEKPFVYYGSSITQGGCASRPGMSYQSIISRRLDIDYINLGFSGNAKAEDTIADYIADLDMSAFVYDYDHNAPSVEHLAATHERMFKKIRNKHPDIPIIMMQRPKFTLNEDEERRLKIIKSTYENAVASGDKNVYFISGRELMKLCGDEGTVDNCHPTDLGFYSMAKALGDLIDKIKG